MAKNKPAKETAPEVISEPIETIATNEDATAEAIVPEEFDPAKETAPEKVSKDNKAEKQAKRTDYYGITKEVTIEITKDTKNLKKGAFHTVSKDVAGNLIDKGIAKIKE